MPSSQTRASSRIAIVGGGIAGVTCAWQIAQLARDGALLEAVLYEASPRFGGIVETVHRDGFTIECGPDGWVTEKPWARTLAGELGLGGDLLPSNDAIRKTHILIGDGLRTMPDGMRMMVPTDLDAMDRSDLFSPAAKAAYRAEVDRAAELKAEAPDEDESIASFTHRHFGQEILDKVAAPLLSGVLGGDVETLSVRAVVPEFVRLEQEHGSLIQALQHRLRSRAASSSGPAPSIFTTLRGGLGGLVDGMLSDLPAEWQRPSTPVTRISRSVHGWSVQTGGNVELFDQLVLATPAHVTRELLAPINEAASGLLQLEASSAIVVALAYGGASAPSLPPGFGFLVPPGSQNKLLACTFMHEKFTGRVPPGSHLLRAFFGGPEAERLTSSSDDELAQLAQRELAGILGPLATPSFFVVRRWPRSLPQYAVGHLERMAELQARISAIPGLTLLGNTYRGVGLPDLVRDARAAAHTIARA